MSDMPERLYYDGDRSWTIISEEDKQSHTEYLRADIVSEREKRLKEAVRDLAAALSRIVPYRGRVVYTPTRCYDVNPINTDTVDGCYLLLEKHADTIRECE